MFVRQVADQLISAGCELWFAEYITFDWRLRQNDGWVKAQIAAGIAHSEWGVVFASEDYMASGDCRLELDLMTQRLGTQRIVQVSLDGTRLSCLDKRATIQCASGDVMEAVDFIAQHAGLAMANPARPGRTLTGFSKRIGFGRQFALDAYGWRRWWLGAVDARLGRYDSGRQTRRDAVKWGPFLQRDVCLFGKRNAKIFMNLRYGAEQPADRDKWAIDFQGTEDAGREKDVLNKLNEYAAKVHFPAVEEGAGVEIESCGVHVLLKDSAFGHVALTYKLKNESGRMWMRKVSIHLRNPGAPLSYYEFVYTFFWLSIKPK